MCMAITMCVAVSAWYAETGGVSIAAKYDGKVPRAKQCTCRDSRFSGQVALPHADMCVTWTERRGTSPCGQLTLEGAMLRRRLKQPMGER